MSVNKQPVDYVLKDKPIINEILTKKHRVLKFITTTVIVIMSVIGFLVFSYAASCCASYAYVNTYQVN